MIFSKLFKSKPAFSEEVQALYSAIVNQSRQEPFYAQLDVADTVEGRYDMIVLHAFFVMRRLKTADEASDFAQSLWDLMFADMDLSLRELGVGDMGLARRVPKMAEAFYGRVKAYEEALAADDENESLRAALDRNLYRKIPPQDESLTIMAHYVRREAQNLENTDISSLMQGKIQFGTAPELSKESSPDD